MRKLNGHKVNPANDLLEITVLDNPGAGGACHQYRIDSASPDFHVPVELAFQNGPIAEAGVNGITHEALLAVLVDRMQSFQAGPYACRENALALTKLEEAQHWLHHRTKARMDRGVEGTREK